MKRPTKGTLELSALGAITLAALGLNVWRHGVLQTVALVIILIVFLIVLEGVLAVARKLGR